MLTFRETERGKELVDAALRCKTDFQNTLARSTAVAQEIRSIDSTALPGFAIQARRRELLKEQDEMPTQLVAAEKLYGVAETALQTEENLYRSTIKGDLLCNWKDAVDSLIPAVTAAAEANYALVKVEAELRRHGIQFQSAMFLADLSPGHHVVKGVVSGLLVQDFTVETLFSRWLRRLVSLGFSPSTDGIDRSSTAIHVPNAGPFQVVDAIAQATGDIHRNVVEPQRQAFASIVSRFDRFIERLS